MNFFELFQIIASLATAIGIFVAVIQLYLSLKVSQTNFEDDYSREYREIIHKIPVEALLGEELSKEKFNETLDDFYNYFDLTNGEVFLRQVGRISCKTWKDWSVGIESNLGKKAFHKAWEYIKKRDTDSFLELRRFERENFKKDPKDW